MMADIYQATDSRNIQRVAERLKQGDIGALPTETVYGLAGNALDPAVVGKIFKAKGRPSYDPLIVHISGLDRVEEYAEINPLAQALAEQLWPGALTLILPKRPNIPGLVTSGLPTVALRCPNHPITLAVLNACGLPLAAPSANPFSRISPTTAQHVEDHLGSQIDFILDGGQTREGLESTVLDVSAPPGIQVLRPGSVSQEQIERTLRKLAIPFAWITTRGDSDQETPKRAPGLLDSHYSPTTPLFLFDGSQPDWRRHFDSAKKRIALLLWGDSPLADEADSFPGNVLVFNLNPTGSATEAAHNLYALMHELDGGQFDEIWAMNPQGSGLAQTVADRLQRASREWKVD